MQIASETGLSGKGVADVARKAVAFTRHVKEFQDCISSVEKCEKRVLSPLPDLFYWELKLTLQCSGDLRNARVCIWFGAGYFHMRRHANMQRGHKVLR